MSKIIPRGSTCALRAQGLLTFLGAYHKYKAECALIGRTWDNNTQIKYESSVENRIVPHLRNHDRTPIQDYSLEDFLHVIDELKRVGQNNDPADYKLYDEDTLGQYLHIMKTVVKVASLHESFVNVFEEAPSEAQFTDLDKIHRMKRLWLTPKSFSVKEEIKVLNYIVQNLDARGENAALFLMAVAGLRVGEACAVNFSYIQEMKNYPGHYYLRLPQSTVIHSNQVKVDMKTYNGHRNIPLPPLAVKVLFMLREKRLKAMGKCPGCNVSIDNMWIAYMGKRQFIRCSADAVTRHARKMFEELGMRRKIADITEYLRQDSSVVEEEQVDLDEFAMVETEPTAYIFRRNFATHMAILGLSHAQIAYIMGHVIDDPQIQRSDFREERELFAIKQKMDQRPLLNEISNSFTATLQNKATVQTEGYRKDFIVPPQASRVQFSLTAKEPNDSIDVTVGLADGVSIHEEVGIHGTPFPHHFARNANVLKAYHDAYANSEEKIHI